MPECSGSAHLLGHDCTERHEHEEQQNLLHDNLLLTTTGSTLACVSRRRSGTSVARSMIRASDPGARLPKAQPGGKGATGTSVAVPAKLRTKTSFPPTIRYNPSAPTTRVFALVVTGAATT
jgi:hypothetical protein